MRRVSRIALSCRWPECQYAVDEAAARISISDDRCQPEADIASEFAPFGSIKREGDKLPGVPSQGLTLEIGLNSRSRSQAPPIL